MRRFGEAAECGNRILEIEDFGVFIVRRIHALEFRVGLEHVDLGFTAVIADESSRNKVPVYIQPTSDTVPDGCELRAGMWICMEHKNGLRRLPSFKYNPNNCVVSQAYPIWNGFSCEVGPFDDVELGKSKLDRKSVV